MYYRSERPLTDAERQILDQRLLRCDELVEGAVGWFLFASFIVAGMGICVFAAMIHWPARSETLDFFVKLASLVLFCVLVSGGLLTSSLYYLVRDVRRRRQVREAKAEGMVLVEQIESTTAALWVQFKRSWLFSALPLRLFGIHFGWHWLKMSGKDRVPNTWLFLETDEDRIGVVPVTEETLPYVFPLDNAAPWEMPACLEVARTKIHGLHLTTKALGCSVVPFEILSLRDIVGERSTRAQIARQLDHMTTLQGRLATLADHLRKLLAEPLAPATETGSGQTMALAVVLSRIQCRIEQQLGIRFGVGRLHVALKERQAAQSTPLTAADLREIVQQALPDQWIVFRPLRPSFYRLRDALRDMYQLPKKRVRPSTPLDEVIGGSQRADDWKQLGRRIGQSLPPLIKGKTPNIVGFVGGLLFLMLYVIGVPFVLLIEPWAKDQGIDQAWWFQAPMAVFIIIWFWCGIPLSICMPFHWYRNRFRLDLHADYRTVGDLARWLAATGIDMVTMPATEQTVWLNVRDALAKVTNRRPCDVQPETSLE